MRFLNALNKANPKVNLLADGCFTYRATFRQVQTLCFSWSSDNAPACHPQAALHFMASTSLPGRRLSHSFVPPLGTSLLSYSVYLYRKVAWWTLGCFENEHSAVCSTSFRLIICIGSFFLTHWYVWMITENRSNVHPLGYIYINRSLAYSQAFW